MVRLGAALMISLLSHQTVSSEMPGGLKNNWDEQTFRYYLKNWRAAMASKTKDAQSSETVQAPYRPGEPFEVAPIVERSAAQAAHMRSPSSTRKKK